MQEPRPTAGHFPALRTICVQGTGNTRKVTGQAIDVPHPTAHECMNRAQRCKSFAPESYRRSTLESSSIRRLLTLQCAAVTFWHAVQLIAQPCTRKSMASSQTKRRLEERFYAVFTGQHAAQQKKYGAKSVCARLLHSTRHCLRRTTQSGPSQTHNNSGRVAPRCFVECVHGGLNSS